MTQTPEHRPHSYPALLGLTRLLIRLVPGRLAGVFALILLASITEGFSLVVLIALLDAVGLSVEGSVVEGLAAEIQTLFISVGLPQTLLASLLVFVALVSLRALLLRFETTLSYDLENRTVALLRKRLFRALTLANWHYLSKVRSSKLTFVLTEEVDRLDNATDSLLSLATTATLAAAYLGFAFYLSWQLSLVVLACGMSLLTLLRNRSELARHKGEAVSAAFEGLYRAADEHLAGIKMSKSHGFEEVQASDFLTLAAQVQDAHQDVAVNFAAVSFWFEVGAVVTLSLTLYMSFNLFDLTLDGVLLLIFLFSRLIPQLSRLQSEYQSLLSDLPAYYNVIDLIETSEAAAEGLQEGPAPTFRQAIQLSELSFRYDVTSPPVLDRLTLSIEAFKTTALVGPSGAGKSTLADLVVGLLTPQQGNITIDGVPLEASLKGWRNALGYVSQTPFLFNDTVRANLLAAKPSALEADLYEALEAAAALSFVKHLPRGIDTVVGERGARLSGGEKQRLALARALLRRPSLLILDEATSSLDIENEKHILNALKALQGKVTVLIIAHRLATVRSADVIYVMERGRLVEAGSWQSLLDRGEGKFRAWCQAQGLVAAPSSATP